MLAIIISIITITISITLTFCLGINTVYWFQGRRVVRVGNGGQVTCPRSHSWEVSEARFEPRTSHLQAWLFFSSWNQYYILVPRQKSGKGRQWGSNDLLRVTQLGSV